MGKAPFPNLIKADTDQVIAGFGLGLTLQVPNIATQTVLPDSDVSIGLSVLNFFSFLAGSIFVTISQTLLENKLVKGLEGIVPNLDPSTLANGGAGALRGEVSADMLPTVLAVYNDSIRSIWYLALALACLILLASFGVEWKSVKKPKEKSEDPQP